MNAFGPAAWSRPLVTAVDVAVVVWLVLMLALGALAMGEINRLASAADSFVEIAQEETDLASALAPLRDLPLVSDRIESAQRELNSASARTAANAEVTRSSLRDLARIAFAVVALVALFPILTFYVPMRITRHAGGHSATRERREPA
jgi:predicted PurR-regulated permease PerM